MGDCIVEEWLRPLNLEHYTQAFLDNGYDDLEVCKQIGEPDLDAIGVLDPGHRKDILDAVGLLRDQAGSAVYFTLENPDYASYGHSSQPGFRVEVGGTSELRRPDSQVSLGDRKSILTYPQLQMTVLLRERLTEDDVKLNEQPYSDENGKPNSEALQRLASRYADQLSLPVKDVFERLEELHAAILCQDGGHSSEPEVEAALDEESPSRGVFFGMISVYGQSSRSVPHPLPPLASMSCVYVDPIELDRSTSESGSPSRAPRRSLTPSSTDPNSTGAEAGSMTSESSVKEGVSSTLGRLLKSVTIRRPGKKYTYRQHQGDLNASEMMMSDDERIQLMILVKEGKLSIDEAVEMVKNHRRERRPFDDFDSNRHDVSSSYSTPLSSPCPGESNRADLPPRCSDSRSRLIFGSPFSRRKGSGGSRESDRLTHCFAPLLHRKKSESLSRDCSPSAKMRSFGWSPPPLPPLPRGSGGAIVESMSAECMVRYNGSSPAVCSPLLASRSGDIQPSVPVRKSRSLHSSVPPRMALTDEDGDGTLRSLRHHYENVRDDLDQVGEAGNGHHPPLQNGVCREEDVVKGERTGIWVDWTTGEMEDRENLDGTLTNAGQRVVEKTIQVQQRQVNPAEKDQCVAERNGHRSKTPRRTLKETEELVSSSTDSLTNAVSIAATSGACGISSSSSHSSMSTEEEPGLKLPYINRVRSKVDYIPSSSDDRDALTLKKGDIIHMLGIHDSRLCRGILNNQIGTFRSTDVEPVHEDGMHLITPRHTRPSKGRRQQRRPKPKTIEDLLARLGLQHLAPLFLHHGFGTLEDFSELDETDLDELSISNPEERVKLLTAAQLLLDTEQSEFDSCSRSASQSPALSQHDASSQTVLTHFSTRERSISATDCVTGPSSSVPLGAGDHRSVRYASETSSDDQEILSITNNGAIVISWGAGDAGSFITSCEAVDKQSAGISLSDSSLASGRDAATGSRPRRFADDRSSVPAGLRRRSGARWQHTEWQPGVRMQVVAGTQTGTESQTDADGAVFTRGVSRRAEASIGRGCGSNHVERIRGHLRESSSSPKTGSRISASSPVLSDGAALVSTSVTNSPSVKTAHVRQLVTSSPLRSFDSHLGSLGVHESGLSSALGDDTLTSHLRRDSLPEQKRPEGGCSTGDGSPHPQSVDDFLTSLGLSMYSGHFALHRLTTTDQLRRLDKAQLRAIGVRSDQHVQRLVEALDRDWTARRRAEVVTQVHPVAGGAEGTANPRRSWTMSRVEDGCLPPKTKGAPRGAKVTDRV